MFHKHGDTCIMDSKLLNVQFKHSKGQVVYIKNKVIHYAGNHLASYFSEDESIFCSFRND